LDITNSHLAELEHNYDHTTMFLLLLLPIELM